MTTSIIHIGNSRGIRIPKAVLDQTGLEGEVELSIKGDKLIIAPKRKPREGWAEMLKEAERRGDLELTEEERDWLDAPLNSFDNEDWVW